MKNLFKAIRIAILFRIFLASVVIGGVAFATQDKLNLRMVFAQKDNEPEPILLPKFQTIILSDALGLFYYSKPIIIDVRDKEYYDYGHIEGAINLTLPEIERASAALLGRLRSAPNVLIYCAGNACQTSFIAANSLQSHGLQNILVYSGGWKEWRSCRLPITMSNELRKEMESEQKQAQNR